MTRADCEKILSDAGLVQSDNYKFWYFPGTYYLAYGEYSSRNYYVRHRKGENWGIKVVYYYYPGTFNVPSDHFLGDIEISELLGEFAL